MGACPGREQLAQLLAEQLGGAEADRVEAHVETCDRCQQALADLCSPSLTELGSAAGSDEPRPEFLRRLRATDPNAADTPAWGNGAAPSRRPRTLS